MVDLDALNREIRALVLVYERAKVMWEWTNHPYYPGDEVWCMHCRLYVALNCVQPLPKGWSRVWPSLITPEQDMHAAIQPQGQRDTDTARAGEA